MLAIATQCTESYTYALSAQMPLVVQALRYAGNPEACFIMAGDKSKKVKDAFKDYEDHLKGAGVKCHPVFLDGLADNKKANPHEKDSNLVIARMQNAAWNKARSLGAEQLWNLESDILPEPKTLRTLMGVLDMDPGWYDAAIATYPNQGFIGGRGTPVNWICPNAYPEERNIPLTLTAKLQARDRRIKYLKASGENATEKEKDEWKELEKELRQAPPKGTIWQRSAVRWRMRGWLDEAYPGIGLGSVVPIEWMGVGCTLMSRRALDLAHFIGYDGGCTQDLWMCWRAWHPAGLRLAASTHALASHVKRIKIPKVEAKAAWPAYPSIFGKPPIRAREEIKAAPERLETRIYYARHELNGECYGHLRMEERVWDGF